MLKTLVSTENCKSGEFQEFKGLSAEETLTELLHMKAEELETAKEKEDCSETVFFFGLLKQQLGVSLVTVQPEQTSSFPLN